VQFAQIWSLNPLFRRYFVQNAQIDAGDWLMSDKMEKVPGRRTRSEKSRDRKGADGAIEEWIRSLTVATPFVQRAIM
jgi:hypothetical protein